MAKILKSAPRPHILIPDTSILWHEDKTHAVDPEFDQFWDQHVTLVTLQLVVPEVVRSELLFQQTTSACKAFDRVTEQLAIISAITTHPQRHRLQKEKIKQQIAAKVDKWLDGKSALVQPIPISRINWEQLCEAAAWRLPPFTLNPKNPEWEKGFRDALILETVVDHIATNADKVNIAFVCNDRTLRETAALRLKSDSRCACYETLQEFSSYIKLTREQLTNEFIRAILLRARRKFFTVQDPECLYYKAEIDDKIGTAVTPLLDNPTSADDNPLNYMDLLRPPTWKRLQNVRRLIPGPEFQSVVDDAEYFWRTIITCVAEYHDAKLANPAPSRRILIAPVSVYWHARVLADGRFRSLTYDRIETGKSAFRPPTQDDIKRFNLVDPADAEKTEAPTA